MSTLAIDLKQHKKIAGKAFLAYLLVSIFCLIFSTIYEHYSHEVFSNYMQYMFLIPLIGGCIPFGFLFLVPRLVLPNSISRVLYGSGIAFLSVGSCLKGVFDIYGTTSDYIPYYLVAGMLLIGIGLIVRILNK